MIRIPAFSTVAELLTQLLGRTVVVRKAPSPLLMPAPNVITAVYTADDGIPATACVCELALAAYAGAALTAIPPAAAKEALATKCIEPNLLDNFGEILNICSHLFNDISTEHVRLLEVSRGTALGAAVKASASKSEFLVEIPGYGGGRMLFCVLSQQTQAEPMSRV